MNSRMEMIFIDSDGQARKTGVGAVMDTPEETWRDFRSRKHLDVGFENADFILDYYNRDGDLSDSIGIKRQDFERITGEKALSESEYREIDRAYWEKSIDVLRRKNDN